MTAIENGIDLVEIKRLAELAPGIRQRFLARVFTAQELVECAGRDASLAGLFAAKEATAKALGCGIGRVSWQELEILPDDQGKPVLHLHGQAQALACEQGWSSWAVSITHTRDHAAAFVSALLEGKPE